MPGALRRLLQNALLRAWTGRRIIATALWPISLAFHTLVCVRRRFYDWGFLKAQRVKAVVIVVGNVVVGGAGKTPTVIAVVHHLLAQQYRVGVISRGYGRDGAGCVEVLADSTPKNVGDEPLLIKRATMSPVFVGGSRYEAARALLAHYPQVQILVCDDGLQHYGLQRDIEICVFDDRGCGNGWLLPAGPLRESWPRHFVPSVGQHAEQFLVLHTGSHPAFAGHTAHRSLAPLAVGRNGKTVPISALGNTGAKPLAALAGIAQPESFFAMLRALNLPLARTLALPDHYRFDSAIRDTLGGYQVICTEKDVEKLWPIVPDALAIPLVLTPNATFLEALDAGVSKRLVAQLSSAHGRKTT